MPPKRKLTRDLAHETMLTDELEPKGRMFCP